MLQPQRLYLDPTNIYPLFWTPRIYLRLPNGPWHEVALYENGVWSHATLTQATHLIAPNVQALLPIGERSDMFELVIKGISVVF